MTVCETLSSNPQLWSLDIRAELHRHTLEQLLAIVAVQAVAVEDLCGRVARLEKQKQG